MNGNWCARTLAEQTCGVGEASFCNGTSSSMLWLVEKGNVEDADSLCAGENAPNPEWSRRRFSRHSYLLFLAPGMQEQSNGIDW